jgi:hypothetical protein
MLLLLLADAAVFFRSYSQHFLVLLRFALILRIIRPVFRASLT